MRSGKYVMAFCLAAALLLTVAGCSFSGGQEKKTIVLKAADVHPESYPTVQGTLFFAKLLEERSGGRIKVQVYPGGQLGQGKTIMDAMDDGVIDIDREGVDAFLKEIPMLEALTMPYLFRDAAHVWRVMDGDVGKRIKEEFAKKDRIVLGYYDSGARSFYSNTPIVSPEDVKEKTFRVLGGGVFSNMMQELGATGVNISYNDIYPALQMKTINGAENNIPSYLTSRHFELAPYYMLDEHTVIPEVLFISKQAWEKLSKEDQVLVQECGQEAAKEQQKLWAVFAEKSLGELKSKGVTVVRPDKEAFHRAVERLYDKYPQHKDLIAQIRASQ